MAALRPALRSLAHIVRLLGIARTLARHDALFPLEWLGVAQPVVWLAGMVSRRSAPGRPGERLARALHELGPSFIKLGQALSTRSDLLGEELAEDLSQLQDRLPPFDGAAARDTVAAELGRPVTELFSAFDDAAVAAASIAQVHYAVDGDGRPVAVKVLRPGIEAAFARDLDLLTWLAALAERTQPALRRLKPVEVVATLAETVRMEMDLRYEAAAADELAGNFRDQDSYVVPAVDWQRTARRVLTLERVEGIPVDEREALLAAGHDPDDVLRVAAETFFRQVFRDGFFHADMHPGNLFVAPGGALVAVDFGIMGRLDRKTRLYLAEMLLGFLTGDYKRVADVHFRAGYVPADKSADAFAQACRSIAEPILGKPLNEISLGRLLAQLFQVTETFEMATQPQLLLLQKTMLVAEGVGRKLNPEVNIWELARPLIEAWTRDNLGPDAKLRDGLEDLTDGLERLPKAIADAGRASAQLADGGIKLHPDSVRALGADRRAPPVWPVWAALGVAVTALLVVLLD